MYYAYGMLDVLKMEERRKKLGISQDEAAKRAGLRGKQQWWNIAQGNGDVLLSTLEKIAAALECKPKDLLK